MKIGYIRIPTADQNTARQELLMEQLGVDEVYIDRISGKNTNRPELQKMMEYSQPDEYQSLHITFYDNCSRSYIEVQIRTKQMDDIAEIGPANHLGYEKKQEKERVRRNAIPRGECIYFDEAYERGMKLLGLDLAKLDVNMFAAMNNSLINDGCGLFRGRLILPYEHLSRFQNDLID